MKNNKKEEKLVLTIFIISFVTINIIGYIFNIDILKIIDKTDNGHAIYFISIFISLVISIISDIIFKYNIQK